MGVENRHRCPRHPTGHVERAFPSLEVDSRAEPWQRDLPRRFRTFEELAGGRPAETVRGAGGAPHCTSRRLVAAFSRHAVEVPHPNGASPASQLRTRWTPRALVSTCIPTREVLRVLAGSRQRELAPPAGEQRGAERAMRRVRQLAVTRDDRARLAARLF